MYWGNSYWPSGYWGNSYWPPAAASTGTFNIYRGTIPGAETLLATGITTRTYIDTAIVNGQIYYYYVTAVAGGMESAPSNEVAAAAVCPGACNWREQPYCPGTTYSPSQCPGTEYEKAPAPVNPWIKN
ncbi:MAG TPA: hypothetical protein VFW40_08665 [Capsulimonadaceae bacterium]|nr:hypothetical protein [Capsulimonadaceae bacterium]